MHTSPVEGWYDCGRPETLLETNRFLLGRSALERRQDPGLDCDPAGVDRSDRDDRALGGRAVRVGRGPPVISDSIVRDSILNADATVECSLLDQSLIGEHALVTGTFQRLNVGDSSEIEIGG